MGTNELTPFLATTGPRATHLTERQLIWIAWRLSSEDDMTACVKAEVEPAEVLAWRKDSDFNDAVMSGLQDKRGSFRPLTENLLPLALRTVYDLLANGSNKDREKALGHLLKIQGLSVDVVRSEDAETMQRMVERMRQPVSITIANPEPRP